MADGEKSSEQRSRNASVSEQGESDDRIGLDLVNLPNEPSTKRPACRARDENPFSLRQFLHSHHGYQHQGARPKVFCEGRQVSMPSPTVEPSRLAAEYPSALPDFVQDHLVIEQCYLNKTNADADFPLDAQPAIAEVGNSKSLPDFLADGAVRNQQQTQQINENGLGEADRLRIELENTRRQLMEQIRRGDALTHDLEIARNNEHEYTQSLAKALEQVEENLERSKIRASSSENCIIKLRQQAKVLNKEIVRLRDENAALRGSDEAAGCSSHAGPRNRIENNDAQQRLAKDLRTAASTAEKSLRHLLDGVDNLRLLASRLERQSQFGSDDESDDGSVKNAGPLL